LATRNFVLQKELDLLITNIKATNQITDYPFTKPIIFIGEDHSTFAPLHLLNEIDWQSYGYHHMCVELPFDSELNLEKMLSNDSRGIDNVSVYTEIIQKIIADDFYFTTPITQRTAQKFYNTLLQNTQESKKDNVETYVLKGLKNFRFPFAISLLSNLAKKGLTLHNIDVRSSHATSGNANGSALVNLGFAYGIAIQLLQHKTPMINYMGQAHLLPVTDKVQKIFQEFLGISLPIVKLFPFEKNDCFQQSGVKCSAEVSSYLACSFANEFPTLEYLASKNVLLLDYSSQEQASIANQKVIAAVEDTAHALLQINTALQQIETLQMALNYHLNKVPFIFNFSASIKSKTKGFNAYMANSQVLSKLENNFEDTINKKIIKLFENASYWLGRKPTDIEITFDMKVKTFGAVIDLKPRINSMLLNAASRQWAPPQLLSAVPSSVPIEVLEDEPKQDKIKP